MTIRRARKRPLATVLLFVSFSVLVILRVWLVVRPNEDDAAAAKLTSWGVGIQRTSRTPVLMVLADNSSIFDYGSIWVVTYYHGTLNEEVLATIGSLRELLSLSLGACEIPDKSALAHLAKVTSCTSLYLSECGLVDDDLRHISGLTNLRFLILDDAALTDEGLVHLRPLQRLGALWLPDNPSVTDAGVAELQKHLPRTVIRRAKSP